MEVQRLKDCNLVFMNKFNAIFSISDTSITIKAYKYIYVLYMYIYVHLCVCIYMFFIYIYTHECDPLLIIKHSPFLNYVKMTGCLLC